MKKAIRLYYILLSFSMLILISKLGLCSDDIASDVASLSIRVSRIALHESQDDHKPTTLSKEETFLQDFITKEYDRDFVTRFIKASPSQDILAQSMGITSGTISKLKNPQTYGPLEPSARRLWSWLQSKDIVAIKKELQLTDKQIKAMVNSLSLLDLSKSAIVYDELGTEMRSTYGRGDSSPRLASEVASYLHRMKGTFTSLNLADNLLSDEGVRVIARELQDHDLLEEINIRSNKIGEVGLSYLLPLLKLERLKKVNIAENVGPGERTLQQLRQAIPSTNPSLLIIVN